MKFKSIFPGLFAAIVAAGQRIKRPGGYLPPIQMVAPQRYGFPTRGWRAAQSRARHKEIARRQRRNAQ